MQDTLANRQRHGQKVSKIKSRKAAGLLGIVAEIIKAASEAGADMITDLANEVIVGVAPARLEFSFIVNCYKIKGDFLSVIWLLH